MTSLDKQRNAVMREIYGIFIDESFLEVQIVPWDLTFWNLDWKFFHE